MIFKKIMLSFLLVLLWFQPSHANSNANDIHPEKEVVAALTKKYPALVSSEDLKKFLQQTTSSLPSKNTAELITKVFTANKTASEKDALNATSTRLFSNALATAKKLKRKDLELWATTQYAFYLYTYRKYEETFPLFMSCTHILDEIEADNIISPAETYKKIGFFLMTVQDYEKADEYLNKAKQYAEPNSTELAAIMDNLGSNNINRNKLVEAQKNFDQALVIAEKANDELRYAKVLGNMATLKFKQKQYLPAIALLEKDIAISQKVNNLQNTIFAMVILGKVHLANNNLAKANETLQKAQGYAQSKVYLQSSDYEINTLILEIAKKVGNDKDELEARRKLETLKQSLAHLDGKEVIAKVNWGLEKEKLQLSIEAEKVKREKETLIKIAALVGCFVLLVIIVLVIKGFRKTLKTKADEYDKKLHRLSLDKERSEKKLKVNNQTLQSYITYLEEKNDQIKELETEMTKIKQSSASYSEQYKHKIEALLQSHLLDNDAWAEFKRAFIQEHSVYYQNLVQNFKDLTDSNLRVIFLMKLGMNNLEIARILGLTLDAVKKAKQRLKAKYGDSYENLLD